MFGKYHYLSHSHNNAARVFLLTVNHHLAGFLSVLNFPHPTVKNYKRVHRLVIFPDYQGIGLGGILLNKIGEIYRADRMRFAITTSQPALIMGLKKDSHWICKHIGRNRPNSAQLKGSSSFNRITISFEMI